MRKSTNWWSFITLCEVYVLASKLKLFPIYWTCLFGYYGSLWSSCVSLLFNTCLAMSIYIVGICCTTKPSSKLSETRVSNGAYSTCVFISSERQRILINTHLNEDFDPTHLKSFCWGVMYLFRIRLQLRWNRVSFSKMTEALRRTSGVNLEEDHSSYLVCQCIRGNGVAFI